MRLRLNGWHPMLRLRLCALLLLVLLVYTAVASAEMQECDPVSAHPEGKIVCRPFGPSATSSVPSPPVASSDAIQQIGQLIDKYGEQAIIAFIRARRSGEITVSVGTGFRTFYGLPNPSYVTPQTILRDLAALRLSPTQLEATLQEQAARTEQTRQATAQQNLKDETERQRKTSADIAAQAAKAQEAENRRSAEEEAKRQRQQNPASAPASDSLDWALISGTDPMTDIKRCMIDSPHGLVSWHGRIVHVHIRVAQETQGYAVGIVTKEEVLQETAPSFHNDIGGLGIRVDQHPFMSVKAGAQTGLMFDHLQAQELFRQMREGREARLRVRFWPYAASEDTGALSLALFARGLEALAKCVAAP